MPENPTIYSVTPTPTGCYSQKLWGFIFLALDPWAVWFAVGWRSLAPSVSLLIFIHHTWVWGCWFCISTSLPSYLSGWMWLLSFLDCQTSIQPDFLMILGDICVVVTIFAVVVRVGELRLPVPPSGAWLLNLNRSSLQLNNSYVSCLLSRNYIVNQRTIFPSD